MGTGSADYALGSFSSTHPHGIYFRIASMINYVIASGVLGGVIEPGATVFEMIRSGVHSYALYYY